MLTAAQIRTLRSAPLTGPNKLKLAMALAEVTQAEVAERLGIKQPQVSDVVRGEYVDMPLETSRRYARCFGVSVEDLFPAREEVA
jgi:transcriptional regulator with XRE-family HTH domain